MLPESNSVRRTLFRRNRADGIFLLNSGKRILVRLCGILFAFACLNATSFAQKDSRRHLVVGSEQEFPPFAKGMTSSEADGFTVDLWKEAAKLNGLDYEIRVEPFKDLLNDFKAGKIDVLLNLAQSEERSHFADFTVPHVVSQGAIFVSDSTTSIRSEQDLKDRKVILIQSGLPYDYFQSHYPAQQTLLVPNAVEGFKALAARKGDAFVISRVMGLVALDELHENAIHPLPAKVGFNQRFAFAVRKGDSKLLAELNDALDSLKESDQFDKIYAHWFGPYEAKYGTRHSFGQLLLIPLAGGLILVLLLLIRVWRRSRDYRASALEAEKRFKAVFEQAAVGISHVRENGQFIMVNDRLCEIIGYPRDELLNLNFMDITHPDDRELGMTSLHKLVTGEGPPFSFEKRYYRKDGCLVWVRLFVSRQTLGAGIEPYIITVTEDITSEKQVESKLHAAQRRYKALLEFAADAILVVGMDGAIEEVNFQAETLLCHAPEKLIGTNLLDYHYPSDRESLRQFLELVRVNGTGSIQNIKLPENTKGSRFVDITASVIEMSDRVVLRAAYRDVSERVLNDLERIDLATRLDLALSAGNIGTGAYYLKENRLDLDERFLELIHLSQEDFTGTPEQLLASLIPEDQERLVKLLSLYEFSTSHTLTFRFYAEDGQLRHINVVIDRVSTDDADGDFLVGVAYDITDRVRAEQELENTNQQLEKLSKAKDEFIARMSHELRTPLNIILGFGQILERQELPPSQQSSVDQILRSGRHLLAMINEILDHARVEAGRLEVEYQAVDLCSICQDVCAQSTSLAEENHVSVMMGDIAILGSISDQVYVWGDPKMLRQVLINLVSNGIKYNRPNGTLKVHFNATKESVKVSVQDTGMGITPSDLEKLFVPFERLSAKSQGVAGTGLGLTISREFLQAMNSDLTVTSQIAEGTTFEFTLARFYPANTQESADSDLVPPGRQVLVFTYQSGFISRRLVQLGFEILEAESVRSAARMAQQFRPKAIIVDTTVSESEIHQLVQRVRAFAKSEELPIFGEESSSESAVCVRLFENPMSKPMDIEELHEFLGR